MAVGVNLDEDQVSGYDYFTGSYYYLETTTEGKPVGFIPNDYRSETEIDVFPVSSRPLLMHQWRDNSLTIYTNTDIGDFVKVPIILENLGRSTATNVKIEVAFHSSSGIKYNEEYEFISVLKPFTKKEITLSADIPKPMQTWFKTRIYYDGEMVDERESSSPFPT